MFKYVLVQQILQDGLLIQDEEVLTSGAVIVKNYFASLNFNKLTNGKLAEN